MGFFSNTQKLNWIALENIAQLESIFASGQNALIFKHSTRCNISRIVLKRFENEFEEKKPLSIYLLDLIQFRQLSNLISEKSNVQHESPQVLVLSNNKMIYNASHESIDANTINSFTYE